MVQYSIPPNPNHKSIGMMVLMGLQPPYIASIISQAKVYFFHANFLSFVQLIFESAFLCSLINTSLRVPVVMHTYIEGRVKHYFNVRHMVFIVFVIGHGKIWLICNIHFIDECITATLLYTQSSCRWSGLLFQMMDFWVSITPNHIRLFIGLSFV